MIVLGEALRQYNQVISGGVGLMIAKEYLVKIYLSFLSIYGFRGLSFSSPQR